ncbi:MAG: 30S ribosomal protein S2 [Candidatus Nealsonbacteria bacterium]
MAKNDFKLDVKEMAKAGLHFGHSSSKTHPKMKPFIHGTRNTVNLIDLDKTKKNFEKVLEIVKKMVSESKKLLIIGTKVQAKKLVEDFAAENEISYVSERWLGGTISNFKVIKKRIDYYNDLEDKKEKGELAKYTKKERGQIDLELERLKKKFEGIRNMERLPDAIFVLDITKDSLAVKEAGENGIITIGVCDVNADPSSIDWVIPANDDSVSAIKYVLNKLSLAVEKGKELEKKLKEVKEKELKEEEKKE